MAKKTTARAKSDNAPADAVDNVDADGASGDGDSPSPVPTDRRDSERRRGPDRRKRNIPVAVDRRKGGDRRQGERRRQIDPTTCERDYDNEEVEFMQAMDDYKRDFGRPFPTWSEVLEVLKSLGYRKVAERSVIPANRNKVEKSSD